MPPDILLVLPILLGFTFIVLCVTRIADERNVSRISRSLEMKPANETFTEAMLAGLPPLVKRYFLHAIKPGTSLASSVRVKSRTLIMGPDGKWRMMKVQAIIAPPKGFVSRSTLGHGPTRVSATDYFAHGVARRRAWLWGIIPVGTKEGPDISRSGIGRLASLSVSLPSTLLPQRGVKWEQSDEQSVRALWSVAEETLALTLFLEADGSLRKLVTTQWADPTNGGNFAYIPYGAEVVEERTFGGYTIPSRTVAGWWFGTPRYSELQRATTLKAKFR